jgi:hypothetical protein
LVLIKGMQPPVSKIVRDCVSCPPSPPSDVVGDGCTRHWGAICPNRGGSVGVGCCVSPNIGTGWSGVGDGVGSGVSIGVGGAAILVAAGWCPKNPPCGAVPTFLPNREELLVL